MITELKWILQVLFFYLISYNIHLYVTCRKEIVYKSETPYTIKGTLGGTLFFSLYQSKDNKFYISDHNPDKYTLKKSYTVDYNPHTIKSIIITTSNKISGKFNNTLLALNYYYRKFGIRSVVLTESTEVVKRCIELNILTEPIQEVNPYGMPILRSMLLYIQEHYDVDQYIYINSDILLNPEVFLIAEAIKDDVKQPYVFVGRVTTTKSIPDNLTSYDYNTHLRLEENILWRRTPSQIDYFVFSKNYPYELIYPVVVGRWCVDSAVLYLSHHMHHQIVDFSQIVTYHQGYDGSEQNLQQYKKEDWEWNFKWLTPDKAEKFGSINANYYIRTPLSDSFLLFSRYLLKKEHFLLPANSTIPY